jgi:ABC-type multidrug transport system fused ATPase/permease subunit
MEGTFRENMDPFNRCSDSSIKLALAKAPLDPSDIAREVESGGRNLSAGERQLLCVARAALHKTPILIMDEPTSSCDQNTDNAVQAMVQNEFQHATVITVAHRLKSIIEYDRILVMEDGRVIEDDSPANLLSNASGHFTSLVNALGGESAKALKIKAGQRPISEDVGMHFGEFESDDEEQVESIEPVVTQTILTAYAAQL